MPSLPVVVLLLVGFGWDLDRAEGGAGCVVLAVGRDPAVGGEGLARWGSLGCCGSSLAPHWSQAQHKPLEFFS